MGGSAPEIPGVKAQGELLRDLRQEVAGLLGRKSTHFPGAQPVSFARKHLLELQRDDYFVCEKTDGIRCMMYLTADGSMTNQVVFLIDRKNEYYHVPYLLFPIALEPKEFHINTILDGELVEDTQVDGPPQKKYLVFDCLALDGNLFTTRPLDKRLGYFRKVIYEPHHIFYKKWAQEIQYLPFIVEKKDMEVAYGIAKMFMETLPRLRHGNDGLIFTCVNTEYEFGTDQHILKWKTEEENTIDFRMNLEFPDTYNEHQILRPDYGAIPKIKLFVNAGHNKYDYYGDMHIEEDTWTDMVASNTPLDGRIAECYLDKQNRWRFHRFRDDKHEANYTTVVDSVIESIRDKVSEEDLLRAAGKIREEWKKRERERERERDDKERAAKEVNGRG
ncbi:Dcp1p-Dcp2p decapping enzyme complex alpha subunit [Mycoblastus sanguinarius]|nr:Dcp1p-Dcp2p decapping enzyme complex alpha subunit [Mycoblastus sanguinarius]